MKSYADNIIPILPKQQRCCLLLDLLDMPFYCKFFYDFNA
uniref:Uncharacterized protein n=1 Tax=Arundo donax TaxID=35708 RepID=A0A0A9FRB5_ARUDO